MIWFQRWFTGIFERISCIKAKLGNSRRSRSKQDTGILWNSKVSGCSSMLKQPVVQAAPDRVGEGIFS